MHCVTLLETPLPPDKYAVVDVRGAVLVLKGTSRFTSVAQLTLCCDLIVTFYKECHLPKPQLRQTPLIRLTMASSAAQRSDHTRLCFNSASEV